MKSIKKLLNKYNDASKCRYAKYEINERISREIQINNIFNAYTVFSAMNGLLYLAVSVLLTQCLNVKFLSSYSTMRKRFFLNICFVNIRVVFMIG